MRTNYVLIDFENVQPASLAGLDAEHFRVLVFVGANQHKISLESAAALQLLGSRAEYVKIAGNGCNALDFHIAFHIGRLSSQNPQAFFHIISKDKGFDPLILHLKERKIYAARSNDIGEIPLLKKCENTTTAAKTVAERVAAVVTDLQRRGTSKPRSFKTLTSTINALFRKQLSEAELLTLLKRLQSQKIVAIEGTKVSYALPPK